MWARIADFILSYRLPLVGILIGITAVMGYFGKRVEYAYTFAQIVPADDPDMKYYQDFKQTFGEDANIFVIGAKDSTIYNYENFKKFKKLNDKIAQTEGITGVLSLPTLQNIIPNREERRFEAIPVFTPFPKNQAELDSLLQIARNIKVYEKQILNPKNGATLSAISLNTKVLHSSKREKLVFEIVEMCGQFSEETGIQIRIAGMPYVRSVMTTQVKAELNIFLAISLSVTILILFLFFRTFSAVFYPLLVIGMVIIWTIGTLGIFGYKITILTGLLPPILTVIGIPNCIYLINKYHQLYLKLEDKQKALRRMIRTIGIVTLITNMTTAIGFFVLFFTDTAILKEFGVVAGINIMATFVITIIFIPSVFSYLPAPKARHTKHLHSRSTIFILNFIENLVMNHRKAIYLGAILVAGFSVIGLTKIKALSFMVDDLPQESTVIQDLHFFEENFSGVMPLEILVDMGKPKSLRKISNLQKINELELFLDSLPYLSPALSPVTFLKAANQAYSDGEPLAYDLPNKRSLAFLRKYLKNQRDTDQNYAKAFTDSTQQKVRISLKIADMGSIRMDSVLQNVIRPRIDSIFGVQTQINNQLSDNQSDTSSVSEEEAENHFEVRITGTTLLFIKGNQFLIISLRQSLGIAIALIALIMGALFRNIRMVLLSLLPNTLPLLAVAGLMGYTGVPLKPSTVLVFSIAFGISVDDSIHFLAKYRMELAARNFDVMEAVRVGIRETGMSMMYTSIVLFFGFIIFTASDFGGTIALGALTSVTLLIAMCTNLILLPALLITFARKITLKPS